MERLADGTNKATTGVKAAMALSRSTLPQINTDNASISGIFHIVTLDGAGPLTAMVDTSGVGDFSNAVKATVTIQVPGTKGNIKKTTKRWEELMIHASLIKRATNINEDYLFAVVIPAGTTCTGTVARQSNVCMVKLVNLSNAGLLGGCIAVQQANGTTTTTTNTTATAKRSMVPRPIRV